MAKSMGPVCKCGPANFLWMIIAVIIMGVGLWLLVGGIQAQWNGAATWQMTLVWYSLGLLVYGIGKMFKKRSCTGCPAHGCC